MLTEPWRFLHVLIPRLLIAAASHPASPSISRLFPSTELRLRRRALMRIAELLTALGLRARTSLEMEERASSRRGAAWWKMMPMMMQRVRRWRRLLALAPGEQRRIQGQVGARGRSRRRNLMMMRRRLGHVRELWRGLREGGMGLGFVLLEGEGGCGWFSEELDHRSRHRSCLVRLARRGSWVVERDLGFEMEGMGSLEVCLNEGQVRNRHRSWSLCRPRRG
jgi:hypothetical protein